MKQCLVRWCLQLNYKCACLENAKIKLALQYHTLQFVALGQKHLRMAFTLSFSHINFNFLYQPWSIHGWPQNSSSLVKVKAFYSQNNVRFYESLRKGQQDKNIPKVAFWFNFCFPLFEKFLRGKKLKPCSLVTPYTFEGKSYFFLTL